ncbi:MAG: carboxypeptidase-like regulatory domain-containing protein, partial [Coriobacteriales bacterium]|nr:carboxypeptidase-like regulatory domain-containing protein [Coriobacteriales bacterium]
PLEVGSHEYRVFLAASENHLAAEKPLVLYAAGAPTASLALTVLDESTGRPLEGATVFAFPHVGTTDASGQATLSLSEAQGELRIAAKDHEAQHLQLVVSGNAELTVRLKYQPRERDDDGSLSKRPAGRR